MAAFTSKASGSWFSGGSTTWNESGVPGSGDTVVINSPHVIVIDADLRIGNGTSGSVTIASGAELDADAVHIEIDGGIDDSGTVDFGSATVVYLARYSPDFISSLDVPGDPFGVWSSAGGSVVAAHQGRYGNAAYLSQALKTGLIGGPDPLDPTVLGHNFGIGQWFGAFNTGIYSLEARGTRLGSDHDFADITLTVISDGRIRVDFDTPHGVDSGIALNAGQALILVPNAWYLIEIFAETKLQYNRATTSDPWTVNVGSIAKIRVNGGPVFTASVSYSGYSTGTVPDGGALDLGRAVNLNALRMLSGGGFRALSDDIYHSPAFDPFSVPIPWFGDGRADPSDVPANGWIVYAARPRATMSWYEVMLEDLTVKPQTSMSFNEVFLENLTVVPRASMSWYEVFKKFGGGYVSSGKTLVHGGPNVS